MIHALITACICFVAYFLPWDIFLVGVSWPVGFYVGREVAQAEYRYIEAYCNKKRENMPWWAVFSWKAWTTKSFFDWFLPLIVSVLFVCARIYLKG